MTEEILDRIFEKIAVRPPYFALKNLNLVNENLLKAEIPVEQNLYKETGNIAAAEAGRHLAILGSCVAALKNTNDSKHYYLAVQANVKRVSFSNKEEKLFAYAEVLKIDRRESVVKTDLFTESGIHLFNIEIKYKILLHTIFEKLFANQNTSSQNINHFGNPYKKDFPLNGIVFGKNTLFAKLGPIKESDCFGHFPNFEAVPVAILMHALSKAAGKLFSEVLNYQDLQYTVKAGIINADNLAFAGSIIGINVFYFENEYYNFKCEAVSENGTPFGIMKLALEPVKIKNYKNIFNSI
jgi:hypothetical protein